MKEDKNLVHHGYFISRRTVVGVSKISRCLNMT